MHLMEHLVTIDQLSFLNGHQFYAIKSSIYKKRKRGCKYMGSELAYITKNLPSISIHRIPNNITQSFIDKIENMVYDGTYDTGSTKIPMFRKDEK